jgi:hypothetical protein
MRPDKNTKEVLDKKKLDCVVVHSESDDLWVNNNIKPILADYKSKAIRLSSLNPTISEDQEALIRQSRRVLLVMTRRFYENEWKNKQLQDLLKNIYFNDLYCVIVALIIGDINKEEINNFMIDIDPTLENQTRLQKVRTILAKQISHNTGLKHVEIVEWHEISFADDFKYIMPAVKTTGKPTYKQIKPKREPPILPTQSESPMADSYVAERRYSISSNDLPLITSLSKSIDESIRVNRLGSQRVYPVNNGLLPSQMSDKRLTKGVLSNQNFWISMPTAQTEVYEPVSTAGPANEGNKEAYLKRFGVSHGYVGYISEQPPPDNPLPKPSFEASTNYRTNKSVRLTRLDLAGVDGGQDDQSDIYDPNVHSQPIGWTTTDSGRRIIVPESMLTKLGGAEMRLASISETNETLSKKKNKKRIDKKLKIQSQSYLVNEANSTRPSSVEDDYKDTKAIIRSKSTEDKRQIRENKLYKTNNLDNQLNEDANRKNFSVDNQIQKNNLLNEKRRNSLSRLQDMEEMTEEKRIQSIIKDNTNGESVKASLSGIKVTKKVTYASTADKKLDRNDAFVNELDEMMNETSEKKKKKKKKSKKSKTDDFENEN